MTSYQEIESKYINLFPVHVINRQTGEDCQTTLKRVFQKEHEYISVFLDNKNGDINILHRDKQKINESHSLVSTKIR